MKGIPKKERFIPGKDNKNLKKYEKLNYRDKKILKNFAYRTRQTYNFQVLQTSKSWKIETEGSEKSKESGRKSWCAL